jgi:hypothetical protein
MIITLITDPEIHQMYDDEKRQREFNRILKLQNDLNGLNSRVWGIENSTHKYYSNEDSDRTDAVIETPHA